MKEQKRKRVTKACDHCVKRRRACVRKPDDEPCDLCTASGRPEACTYNKPVKRRGPVAGYTTLAKQSSERLELLRLLLGDMFLLSPQVEQLAEYCLQRRMTATLAPLSPVDRTEEEKMVSFARSAVNTWLEARSGSTKSTPKLEEELDELDDDSSPNQGSTVASTSEVAYEPPTPIRDNQFSQFAGHSAVFPQQHPSFHVLQPPPTPAPFPNPEFTLPSTRLHHGPSSSNTYFAKSSHPFSVIHKPLPALPSPPPRNQLPPHSLLSKLIDNYFSGVGHNSLPIIDRQALRDWVKGREKITRHAPNSPNSSSSPLVGHELVFAMLAIAARSTTLVDVDQGPSALVDLYKVQAGQALATAIRAPTLHTVQAAVLLAHVDLGRDDLTSASAHFGVALTLAYALGLHQSSSSFYDRARASQAEYGIRSFGAIIVLDTLLALRLGRPPLLASGTFDLPLPSTVGPEEEATDKTALTPLPANQTDSGSNPAAASPSPRPSTSAEDHPLSTFRQLIKLSLAAMPLLYALNYPIDGPPRPIDHLFSSFTVWEDSLPAHLQLTTNPQSSTHKFELNMLCSTFKILCTRPRSPNQPLSALCITQTLRTLAFLELHINTNPRHLSTSCMSPIIITLASALLSPTAEVGTHSHWETLVNSARHYSQSFPSTNDLLATLAGLPQTSNLPSFASLRTELARAEQTAREEAEIAEVPPLETETQQVTFGTSLLADLGTGFEGLEAAQLGPAGSSTCTTELELLAHLGSGGMGVGGLSVAGDGGDSLMPLLGSGINEFAADFADWSPAIPQATDQFLRSLGVRGPTRPPSPSAPNQAFPAVDDAFDLDLVGRWQGVSEDQWEWPEALNFL